MHVYPAWFRDYRCWWEQPARHPEHRTQMRILRALSDRDRHLACTWLLGHLAHQACSYRTLRLAYQEAIRETLEREVFLRKSFQALEKQLRKVERGDMIRQDDARRVSEMDTDVASDVSVEYVV